MIANRPGPPGRTSPRADGEAPPSGATRPSLRLIGRAFRLLWESAPAEFVAGSLLWAAGSLVPVLSLYLLKWLVDDVARAGPAPSAPGSVLGLVALLGLTALVGGWCQVLAGLVDESQGQKLADHVTDAMHGRSVELDLEYYDRARYHRMLYRAQQEAPYRPLRVVKGVSRLVQGGLSLLAVAGILASLHALVVPALATLALPAVLLRLRYGRLLPAWQRAHTEEERRAAYYHSLLIDEAHAKEVRLFDLGPVLRGWFLEIRGGLRRGKLALSRRRAAVDVAVQTLSWAAVFGVVAYVVGAIARGARPPGDLVLYYLAVHRGLGSFQDVLGALSGLYEDQLFLASYQDFLELRPRVADPSRPRDVPRPFREGVVLDRVGFAYDPGGPLVLDDVSLAIRPGQVVALVGANGAGKTTLVKLLCRLYDPTSGRITLDGVPLDQYAVRPLRRAITALFQDFARYSLTLRRNIWLGDVALAPDSPGLDEAARLAGANGVAAALPDGYETVLGRWQEGGTELSGGQWQKVALARTLARGTQLLILDEPTSGMDPTSEARFLEALRRELRDRSVLLVSHRLSTVRLADRICVLAGGRVVEQGTHDELARRGGAYARFFAPQIEGDEDAETA